MKKVLPGPPGPDDSTAWWAWPLELAERACCPARPAAVVVMPAADERPHPVDLLLCAHHYRSSVAALLAAGAAVYDTAGVVIPAARAAPEPGGAPVRPGTARQARDQERSMVMSGPRDGLLIVVGAALLVLGATRPAGGPAAALGPVTQACLRHSPCPGVIVAQDARHNATVPAPRVPEESAADATSYLPACQRGTEQRRLHLRRGASRAAPHRAWRGGASAGPRRP